MADGIEHAQSELRALRHDAAELHMTIDPATNKVVPNSTFNGPPMAAFIAEDQLQPRLNTILAEANAVDQELATAIRYGRRIHLARTRSRRADPGNQLDNPPAGRNAATGQWELDTSRGYDDPNAVPHGPYPPWRPTAIPEKLATGPSTGLLTTDKTGLSDTADGFDLQQGYKLRLTGTQLTGITKMVQGADGKWYQARWLEIRTKCRPRRSCRAPATWVVSRATR